MSDIAALVAGNLDIWTSATQRKSGAGRGGGKRISLYGIERLRALILDLAVRGKLVPQDSADEPAAVLLQKIRKERIGTKQLGKTLSASGVGDRPLGSLVETPPGWAIVRLSDVILGNVGGGTPSKAEPAFWGGDIPWASVKDIGKSKFVSDTQDRITEIGLARSSANIVPAGNIVLVTRMGLGQLSINTIDLAINQDLRAIFLSKHINIDYCYNYFLTCEIEGAGMTVKGIKLDDLLGLPFPLPPLAEQRRIVAKVDELMALCDALERESADAMAAHQALVEELLASLVNSADATELATNWARLETHFDTIFTTDASIEALKQTILDLAVRGMLVEQDTEDEAANVLLKQLKSDRSWVVGKGRGGKPKAIAPILDGSELYELPIGWLWARVADVFQVTSGGTIEASLEKDVGAFPYLKVADMNLLENDVFIKTSSRFIDPDEKQMRGLIRPNSIIFPKRGGAIATNKKRLVTSGIFVDLNIMAITVPEKFSLKYVYFWLQGIDLALLNTGTSVPQINHQDIDPLAFPIPPLAEQHRIVAKVDALMALCDQLKARLADAAQTQRDLADAITERAAA